MSDKRELPRSELARQRRAKRAVKELDQTGKRAVRPVAPVVSRVPKTRNAGMNLKRVENRRHFNVALGMPDIHLRRPAISLPGFGTGWRFTSLVTVFIIGVAIYLILTLPLFHIPSVTVLGNERLTRDEISAVTGVIGQSVFMVQPEDAATRLRMNFPELASVDVKVYLPNHVYVTVSERTPVILWQQGEGYTWIDSEGVAFRPRGVITGLVSIIGAGNPPVGVSSTNDQLSPPPFMQKDLVDAILALAPHVPADSTMFFDPKDGLGWTDARGWKALFGVSARNMPLKVRVYQSLVDSLMSRGTVPLFINVAYPDAPFYRRAEVQPEEATTNSGQ